MMNSHHRWLRGFARSASVIAAALMLSSVALAGDVRFSSEGHAQHPVWSLDGKYVAFEVNRFAGDIKLYVSEVKAGAVASPASEVKLPGGASAFGGGGQVVVNPIWHPQGIMVFEGSNQSGAFRLYYASPGGAAAAEMLPSTKAPGDLTFPSISQDGNLLAFVTDSTGSGDVMSWNRNTDKFQQITSTPGSEMFPQFSADSQNILFTRKKNDVEAIYLSNLSSGVETVVASGNGDQTRPNFAADDKIVYFTNERGQGNWDLAVINQDGSGKRVLAKGIRLPHRARPAISPDGRWVAYAFDDPSKSDSVWISSTDGASTVEITTEFKACGEPALTLNSAGQLLLAYTALPAANSDWRFLHVTDISGRL
ncbi:MAG: PD40 domain-containing protein [Deltaproteobacteria bacterium]|nr:PD40 domain-containing protein [Deltaproteobacteria bacterium]